MDKELIRRLNQIGVRDNGARDDRKINLLLFAGVLLMCAGIAIILEVFAWTR